MKIAIDIREAVRPKRAGKGWYSLQIVRNLLELDKDNADVSYILYTDQPFPEFEHFQNVTQKFFPPSSLRWHFRVLKDVKKEKPDIYFAPSSFIVPALAPRWLKIVATVHDLVAWLYAGSHNVKATIIERITLPIAARRITHFTAVSENTKKDLMRKFYIRSEKISVIPCAASDVFFPRNQAEIESFREKYSLPKRFFLAVGTLEPRKNFITLIQSFAQIAGEIPSDIQLIIIGGKGWEYEEIFREVKKMGVEDRVKFQGYIDEKELPLFYNAASCFVFPSLYEGFGIPPLEAMKSGCPVICSNTSSMPEVVGDAGILINPKSVSELAQAMKIVLSDEKLANDLREKGLLQAKKFSWQISASQMKSLFLSLL